MENKLLKALDETDTAFEYIRNLIKKEYGDTNEKTN